jgi:glycosyltransferase involved in cell wall biosynthesis
MTIVYFYQYFSTSEGSWGTRVYEFARQWVTAGHELIVVTSIYSKSDLKSSVLVSERIIEGIRVKVINILIDNRQPVWKRIWTFIQYATISSWYALTLKSDVVVVSSGPITVGLPGLIARWLRGRKLVFEARDLWPEGAIKMQLLKNKWLISGARWFEKVCYRSSSVVIGLSPGIQKDIQSRFPGVRVESVTNAANLDLFTAHYPSPSDLEPFTYALYFGNIGEVNHSDYLLDAAAMLLQAGRQDITIVLIGEGQLKQSVVKRIENEDLSNVQVKDLMPKSNLVTYVQHALVSVVPLKPLAVFDTSSPNKLFESMAAGVPVIQTTQGWIKDFIEQHGVGYTVDGTEPGQLANRLIFLRDHGAERRAMAERAQKVAREVFDKNKLAADMLDILVSVHER